MKFLFFDKCYTTFSITLTRQHNKITVDLPGRFEVKTSLGAPSKNFVGIELDWPVMLESVTLVRAKSARVTANWIGGRYMR